MPTDPERDKLSNILRQIAEHFITEHEAAHIQNGHTDWVGAFHGLSRIDELHMADIGSFADIDRQTLEWDADCLALNEMIGTVLKATVIPGTAENHAWSIPDGNWFGTPEDAIYQLSFAIYACYRVFAQDGGLCTFEEALASSHPPAQIRINWNVLNIGNILGIRLQLPKDDPKVVRYMQIAGAAAWEAELAWSAVFMQSPVAILHPQNILVGSQLLNEYRNRWSTLREQLDVFKRSGTLGRFR